MIKSMSKAHSPTYTYIQAGGDENNYLDALILKVFSFRQHIAYSDMYIELGVQQRKEKTKLSYCGRSENSRVF